MSRTENLAEKYQGMYRWTSEPDKDGDHMAATNTRNGVVIGAGNDKTWGCAFLDRAEARHLALALLDLIDGTCPNTTQETDHA